MASASGTEGETAPFGEALVFEKLVTDPGDPVCAFSFLLYTREKHTYLDAFTLSHGRPPNAEEMRLFYLMASSDLRIAGYNAGAQALATSFVDYALESRAERYAETVRDTTLNRSLMALKREIRARKSWAHWLRDVVGNLAVNVATILLIGSVLGGYQALARLTDVLEQFAHVQLHR